MLPLPLSHWGTARKYETTEDTSILSEELRAFDPNQGWFESLSAGDAYTITKVLTFTQEDTATLSETYPTPTKIPRDKSKPWSESLSAGDAYTITKVLTFTQEDTATLSETYPTPTKVPPASKSWSESLSAGDAYTITKAKTFTQEDTATLSETYPTPTKISTAPVVDACSISNVASGDPFGTITVTVTPGDHCESVSITIYDSGNNVESPTQTFDTTPNGADISEDFTVGCGESYEARVTPHSEDAGGGSSGNQCLTGYSFVSCF